MEPQSRTVACTGLYLRYFWIVLHLARIFCYLKVAGQYPTFFFFFGGGACAPFGSQSNVQSIIHV